MKNFFTVLLSGFITLAATAQTITITINGTNRNRNYQVTLDGTNYYSNSNVAPSSRNTDVKKLITLTGQQPGSHTISVYRQRYNANNNGNSANTYGNAIYDKTFQLRQGYDMAIVINGNGQVSFTEKRIRDQGRRGYEQNNNVLPMSDALFDQLQQTVRTKWLPTAKITIERDAFLNTANYFTTFQVRQLLLLISSEANRLALAKLAYPRVTDPASFTQLYDVFNSNSSRDDLALFVQDHPNYNNTNNNNNDRNDRDRNDRDRRNNNSGYKTPMADYTFTQLLETVNSQYSQSAKYNTISGSINNGANYFTTSQVRQLLRLINSESEKLALAKQSYLRVTDPANFSTLYDLFYNASSKDELNNYVVQNGGTGNYNNNSRTPMVDYQFSQLVQTVNSQYNQSAKYNTISGALNNSVNYFTTYQVRQLLSLINTEGEKLALAKQSYLRVTDPANFNTLYDLFYNQSSRNELNNYVVQNGGTGNNNNGNYNNNSRTPMTDAAFSQVLQKVSNHFLPWDKARDARDAFNNTANYFSSTQVRQVLTVITSEADRLELAKLAWSRITDPTYFSQLSDLFTSQANRDELNAYVAAHPY